MIIFVGLIVGFVAVALVQAMYGVLGGYKDVGAVSRLGRVRRRTTDDAGEGLIETLIAVVLVGLAAAATLTTMSTTIRASGQHKSHAGAQAWLVQRRRCVDLDDGGPCRLRGGRPGRACLVRRCGPGSEYHQRPPGRLAGFGDHGARPRGLLQRCDVRRRRQQHLL